MREPEQIKSLGDLLREAAGELEEKKRPAWKKPLHWIRRKGRAIRARLIFALLRGLRYTPGTVVEDSYRRTYIVDCRGAWRRLKGK